MCDSPEQKQAWDFFLRMFDDLREFPASSLKDSYERVLGHKDWKEGAVRLVRKHVYDDTGERIWP